MNLSRRRSSRTTSKASAPKPPSPMKTSRSTSKSSKSPSPPVVATQCPICAKKFKQPTGLEYHLLKKCCIKKRTKPLNSELATKVSTLLVQLKGLHTRSMRKQKDKNNPKEESFKRLKRKRNSEQQLYECNICHRIFKSLGGITYHQDQNVCQKSTRLRTNFECFKCNSSFLTQNKLSKHKCSAKSKANNKSNSSSSSSSSQPSMTIFEKHKSLILPATWKRPKTFHTKRKTPKFEGTVWEIQKNITTKELNKNEDSSSSAATLLSSRTSTETSIVHHARNSHGSTTPNENKVTLKKTGDSAVVCNGTRVILNVGDNVGAIAW